MTPETLAICHARAFAGLGRAWSAEEFADLLNSRHVFAVGDSRAFALGRVIGAEAELLTLATDPVHRRQGLASAALKAFETTAADRGASEFFVEVAADNRAARALYRRYGYARAARRAAYYGRPGGRREDALILRKAAVG